MENEIISDMQAWLVAGASILGFFSTVLGILFAKEKKSGKQVLEVIDKIGLKNSSFEEIAKNEGLKLAVKALKKIL